MRVPDKDSSVLGSIKVPQSTYGSCRVIRVTSLDLDF